MTTPTESPLKRDDRGVVTYTFDDVATRNALSLEVLQSINDTLEQLGSDPSVRAIVFTGTGTTFSSGANRSELADPAIVERTTELLSSILTRIDSSSAPVLCRVNGAAFGASLAIVAASDISVAVTGAQLGFPEVRFGLVAGPAAAACVRRMGETAALDLFVTGRRFDSEEGARLHLITTVVAPDELDSAFEAKISEVLLGDYAAIAVTKRVIKRLSGSSISESLSLAWVEVADLAAVQDRSSFVAPRWRGVPASGARDVDWRDVPAKVRRVRAMSELHPDLRGDLSELGRCVLTVGTFDGMHKGHAKIVEHTVEAARRAGLPSVLLTFDPHPAELTRPGSHPAVLTSIARRAELAMEMGIDVFRVAQFDLSYSRLEPAEFAHEMMVERLHVAEVVVGTNFRFGHRAAGTAATLSELAYKFGFAARGVVLVRVGETVVSSTYLRSCIEAGDVQLAESALGRPHRIDGVVEHGEHRGRGLGFPTANLSVDRYAAVPADGVYCGRVVCLDAWGQTKKEELGTAAISVGTNPTFDGQQRRIEAHILDFDSDLYGMHLGFEFHRRLRGMVRFEDVEALVAQMDIDVDQTRAVSA